MRRIIVIALGLALSGLIVSGLFYMPRPAHAAAISPSSPHAIATPPRPGMALAYSGLKTAVTPHGNTSTDTPPAPTSPPASSIDNTYNYNVAVPFTSLTDTIVGMSNDLLSGSWNTLSIRFIAAMDEFYNLAVSKPLLMTSGSEIGDYPVLGNFSSVPPCKSGETENILSCYLVQGWTASRNISLFLLPITLMLTVGAALRNCSTSVTGYADAREAFINWFFSVGETLISLWVIGLALGLSYSIASAFVGFFPVVQGQSIGGVFSTAMGNFITTSGTKSAGADLAVTLLFIFALIMLVVVAFTVIASTLAQNVILLLMVIICPFVFILCTIGPLRWFQGVWWKAMILCLFFAPINRILMTGAMVLMQSAQGTALILAFIFAIALLSIMCTLNFGIVKIVYGSAMEVAGKVTSTVMGVLDLAAAIGGFAIGAGPAGAAVGGALGGAAKGAVDGAMPSGGGGGSSMDSAAAGEQSAMERQKGAAALSGFGNALSRTNIPGFRGFGAGLAGGASAEGRSASMDEAYFRSLRDTAAPLHPMEDAPREQLSMTHPVMSSVDTAISRHMESDPSLMSRTNGINLDLEAAKLANVGKYNAIQRNDPQFSVYAGEKGINGNQHFPEMLERDIVSTAKLDDPSYSRQNPTYHGRNPAWLSPNIHAFDHDVAADVIAANANNFGSSEGIAVNPDYFGSRESMSNPDLHERIAQKVFELRRNNKDWAFSIDEHDRGWQRAFLTMTRSKPWEILNWKP